MGCYQYDVPGTVYVDVLTWDMPISETARIADQLRRSYKGPAWHGPSLTELLADVTESQASRRPIDGAHTIWELVLHISAWLRIARERLSAALARTIAPGENWPAVTGAWAGALAKLDRELQALEDAVRPFPDERLNQRAADRADRKSGACESRPMTM